ncbi:MAG: 50S ribosomal protein L20 [Planctomycetaceae bacterium]|jgi:large subunit ribosomal protein L20|nr:50S ribosomal protein L20 [Planctomycetaceae bacterium]MDC0307599.1 50S ribosomal protein L20 [Planctomycetaceae bacterium]MDG2388494.1 50S ribosomal protein L20 [Planctomycetaceae bacterium]
MRVTIGAARRRKKKRLFKEARGNFGGRSKLLRTVKETILKSRMYAFRDRRAFKRAMRRLWITRLTAACQMRGLNYSEFIHGMKKANLELNRKSLSELAIHEPAVFDEVFELAKAARS